MSKNNVEQMLAIAKNNGILVDPTTVKVNESGLDFLAIFASTIDVVPWVLRQPRRDDVVETARYEKKVLDLVAKHLRVEVPDWQVHTSEFIAYPILSGTPMATINMETKNYEWYLNPESLPELCIQTWAEALVELHGIHHDLARDAGIRVKQPSEARASLREKMNEVKRVFGVSQALWDRWQKWLADDTFWPAHSVLVHGDLHPGHILVDENGKVTGLLDWTEAEVADPATDFTVFYMLFGDSGLADFIKRYEKAGGRVWPRMHEHIAEMTSVYPVILATFALKSGLEEFKIMAQQALGVDENGKEISY
ncbi:macrolide 2'-phosphotransferase MphJ [Brevibacillus sp. AG]|uniref:macrolide 2'-phosphotransferase MphJ n=1 Tax=Brevibacillus sp. AG TaxID=3020891 RepID=UPI00085298CE|nr:macrolide 2'-phosphotransferase MphJ [Brevibacillus sp. AG]MDC0764727.1 macrolide 2'-phosphotransferase MphJ [Brevibacillus sp. AG]